MTIRVLAASLILATGFILAPDAISARVGGFAAAPMHGVVRAPLVRPGIAPVAPPALAAPRAAPFARGAARFPLRHAPFFRHRHQFGFPAAGWWSDPWCGDCYDTSGGYGSSYLPPAADYPSPDYPPAAYPAAYGTPARERVIYVMPYRPGCTEQRQTVASERGGERTITIVRC